MLNIAHRGYSQVAPENTLAAFEAAARCGADMIETDIHVCGSGEIVVVHDDDVAATTDGTGRVANLTLAELKRLDAGAWFSPAFAGQRIPTLDDLIEFYQAHPGLELLLEFKGDWAEADARRVADALSDASLRDRCILESFSPATMAALQRVAPNFRRGLLIDTPYGPPTHSVEQLITFAQELGCMALCPAVELTLNHPDLVAKCHAAGLQVMVWTADQPAEFTALINLKVTGICTNRPGYLAGHLTG